MFPPEPPLTKISHYVYGILRWPGFEPRVGHVGFVLDKVALGQVFSVYFAFHCQFSFHRLLHTHHPTSGAGTIGQLVTDAPNGLSLTPPPRNLKKIHIRYTGFVFGVTSNYPENKSFLKRDNRTTWKSLTRKANPERSKRHTLCTITPSKDVTEYKRKYLETVE
jgi:hypothetical protein